MKYNLKSKIDKNIKFLEQMYCDGHPLPPEPDDEDGDGAVALADDEDDGDDGGESARFFMGTRRTRSAGSDLSSKLYLTENLISVTIKKKP